MPDEYTPEEHQFVALMGLPDNPKALAFARRIRKLNAVQISTLSWIIAEEHPDTFSEEERHQLKASALLDAGSDLSGFEETIAALREEGHPPPDTSLISVESAWNDPQPLPLIVSRKWAFPLQQHEGRWFSIQDWIVGLTGEEDSDQLSRAVWRVRQGTSLRERGMSYIDPLGRTYQRPFTDAEGLYRIATYLREAADRPALTAIKRYLAKAGVIVDEARRDTGLHLAEALTHFDPSQPLTADQERALLRLIASLLPD